MIVDVLAEEAFCGGLELGGGVRWWGWGWKVWAVENLVLVC